MRVNMITEIDEKRLVVIIVFKESSWLVEMNKRIIMNLLLRGINILRYKNRYNN